MSTHQMNTK